jgi:diguanylate cyclase (GGDEF)-like protein/PAS domain S-box-containing protein
VWGGAILHQMTQPTGDLAAFDADGRQSGFRRGAAIVAGVTRTVSASREVAVYLLVCAGLLAAYTQLTGHVQDLLYCAICLLALGVLVGGMRRYRPQPMSAWLPLGTGLALFIAGDLIWTGWEFAAGETPFPSPADGLYLIAYPLLFIGLAVLVRRHAPEADPFGFIDAVIVTTAFGLFVWSFVIDPYLADETLSLPALLVSIAYPVMDVALFGITVRLFAVPGRPSPAVLMLGVGALMLALSDTGALLLYLAGDYPSTTLLDVGWLGGYVLWAAAVLHPSAREADRTRATAPTSETPISWLRLTLLASAALAAPAILAIEAALGLPIDVRVVVFGAVLMTVLIAVRIRGIVKVLFESLDRVRHAAAREHALRLASERLNDATSAPAVCAVAQDAAEQMAAWAPDVGARIIVLTAPDGTRAPACNGSSTTVLALPGLPENTRLALSAGRPVELEGARLPAVWERLMLDQRAEAVALIVPFGAVHPPTNGLLVSSRKSLDADMRHGLEVLASTLTLSLQRLALTEDLQLREARFRSLVHNSFDVVSVVDPGGAIHYLSRSAERVLGLAPEQLENRPLVELLHPDDQARVTDALQSLARRPAETAAFDCRVRHGDGTWRHCETTATNMLGDPAVAGIVLTTRDITDRRVLEEQLRHRAFHDSLTGLPNRARFTERVGQALGRPPRGTHDLVAVLFIDLDDFKTVNDRYGHAVGDELLRAAGQRIRNRVRSTDLAARFGGDEFSVLLEDLPEPAVAGSIADGIGAALRTPFQLGEREITVRASIGVAYAVVGHADITGLLRNADLAMYEAKMRGKGRAQMFEPRMRDAFLGRMRLHDELQQALDAGELQVHYQPVFELATRRIVGFEALLRWLHPARGLVPAAEFIHAAQESGMVVPVGRWALVEACIQAAAWQRRFPSIRPLIMSVNLSARQLQSIEIVDQVTEAIATAGIDPTTLLVEVAETDLLADLEQASEALRMMRGLGIRVALDDLGTGTAFGRLRELPVDVLKIDRSLVHRLGDGQARTAAQAIAARGRDLHLQVVAAGIETAEQLIRVTAAGCLYGQGFLLARPDTAAKAEALLQAQVDGAGTATEQAAQQVVSAAAQAAAAKRAAPPFTGAAVH